MFASVVVGVVLWLVFVPHHEPHGAEPRSAAFWWLMSVAGIAFGWFAGRRLAPLFAVALVAPQLPLALWTAPRGDDDGLWLLWFPILLAFAGFLALLATATSAIRERRTRRP